MQLTDRLLVEVALLVIGQTKILHNFEAFCATQYSHGQEAKSQMPICGTVPFLYQTRRNGALQLHDTKELAKSIT